MSNPLIVLGTVVLGILLAGWFLVWRLGRKRYQKAVQQLQQFKERSVELNEKLDLYLNRHRELPLTSEEYSQPMQGHTLKVYEGVQDKIQMYRNHWLECMDVWDQAQKMLDEKSEGSRTGDAVLELLKLAHPEEQIANAYQDCEVPLDLLANAHEQADALKKNLNESLKALQSQIDRIREVPYDVQPYQADQTLIQELIKQADQIRTPDPVGAIDMLHESDEHLISLGQWTEKVLHHHEGSLELEELIKEIRNSEQSMRTAGFLFAEEGSSPAPQLQTASEHLDAARQAMNRADVKTSGVHLEQGFAAAEEAESLLTLQREMRQQSEQHVQNADQNRTRLEQHYREGQQEQKILVEQFAAPSWHDVSEHLMMVRHMLDELNPHLDSMREAVSPQVQHYLKSAQLLSRIQKIQTDAEALLQELRERMTQLIELRTNSQGRIRALESRSQSLRTLLESNTADRPLSNQRYHMAHQAWNALHEDSQQRCPNWPLIEHRVQSVEDDFERVEHMVQEDLRLAAEADKEIVAAERQIRKTRSFYRAGVTADVSEANSILGQARQHLQVQAYEQAIEVAQQATEAARLANQRAIREMQERERQLEQERRERVMEQMGEIQIGPILGTLTTIAAEALVEGFKTSRRTKLQKNNRKWSKSQSDSFWN